MNWCTKPATVLLWTFLAVAIARLWLMPLPSSFWVDEMVTAFVVHHPADPSLAVAPQVPASLYYWLPRAAERWLGFSEISYRLPSVLAMALALWILFSLAVRLIHPRAGWFAVFACLAMRGIDYHAADARPYALGIAVSSSAVWFLVRFLDRGVFRDGLLFVLTAGLLWRVHLVYWPFYGVFALYAAARLATDSRPLWPRVLLIFAMLALVLLPVARLALALSRQAAAHVIVKPPTWRDALHLLRWNLVLIVGVGAWLWKMFATGGTDHRFSWSVRPLPAHSRPTDDKKRSSVPPVPADTLLIFAWWLVHPLALYAFSLATGNSLFLNRYLSLFLPGVALSATWVAARLLPENAWRPAAALAGIGAILVLGQWSQWWPSHEPSDWRAAVRMLNRPSDAALIPVVCPSPFVEARWPVWRPDYPLPGFLYAHLPVYPLRGPIVLFPFETSPQAEDYAEGLLAGPLTAAHRFAVYGGAGNVRWWRKWFAARPELAAWQNRLTRFGDVYVVVFQDARIP
ncbi:MAG: glycosyltransferase family 39 protein [Bryobacteraceae bacterium]|jgi:hypothetical protein